MASRKKGWKASVLVSLQHGEGRAVEMALHQTLRSPCSNQLTEAVADLMWEALNRYPIALPRAGASEKTVKAVNFSVQIEMVEEVADGQQAQK